MTDNPVYRKRKVHHDGYDQERFCRLNGFLPSEGQRPLTPIEDTMPKELDIAGLPDGEWLYRGVYRIEQRLPYGRRYGNCTLENPSQRAYVLKPWGGHLSGVYLDLETTGLSGNAGAYAFLAGLGFCGEDAFHVVQLFLAGPAWERNWLTALEAELPNDFGLVTYNGRTFDLPLLRTRYALLHSLPSWNWKPHLDLLQFTRHFYRGRLESCSLSTVELHVLGLRRSEEDIPGRDIPWMYTNYLRSQNASVLHGVFYHNALDIISMAVLQNRIADLAEMKGTTGEDMIRCGDLWKVKGDDAKAELAWKLALEFSESEAAAKLRLGNAKRL